MLCCAVPSRRLAALSSRPIQQRYRPLRRRRGLAMHPTGSPLAPSGPLPIPAASGIPLVWLAGGAGGVIPVLVPGKTIFVRPFTETRIMAGPGRRPTRRGGPARSGPRWSCWRGSTHRSSGRGHPDTACGGDAVSATPSAPRRPAQARASPVLSAHGPAAPVPAPRCQHPCACGVRTREPPVECGP